MTQLLVSVRSAAEARIAVAAGAGLIDVKEPANGPLGRATDDVIRGVAAAVGGRVPVSAALGELAEIQSPPPPPGLAFAKVGLCCLGQTWRLRWHQWCDALPCHCRAVAVAYAEGPAVDAPSVDDVLDFAISERAGAFLIDTAWKDGCTLLDHLSLGDCTTLIERCRHAAVPIALAGSLTADDVAQLTTLRPDWIAVRGAVCPAGRGSEINGNRVHELVQLIRAARNPACPD